MSRNSQKDEDGRGKVFASHLPGELLEDIAAKSVQNGNGLGKVMSLSGRANTDECV